MWTSYSPVTNVLTQPILGLAVLPEASNHTEHHTAHIMSAKQLADEKITLAVAKQLGYIVHSMDDELGDGETSQPCT